MTLTNNLHIIMLDEWYNQIFSSSRAFCLISPLSCANDRWANTLRQREVRPFSGIILLPLTPPALFLPPLHISGLIRICKANLIKCCVASMCHYFFKPNAFISYHAFAASPASAPVVLVQTHANWSVAAINAKFRPPSYPAVNQQ
jgi:hypothetical protein